MVIIRYVITHSLQHTAGAGPHPPETHPASPGKLSLFCAVGLCKQIDLAKMNMLYPESKNLISSGFHR